MDILAIQQMAHTLVKSLTKFDSQRIVTEKQEDGEAIEAAGLAIAEIGRAVKETAADGLVAPEELSRLKLLGEAALAKLEAAGAEIIDQSDNEPEAPA